METKELEKEFLTMIEAQKRTIYKVCYIYANDHRERIPDDDRGA